MNGRWPKKKRKADKITNQKSDNLGPYDPPAPEPQTPQAPQAPQPQAPQAPPAHAPPTKKTKVPDHIYNRIENTFKHPTRTFLGERRKKK